ncbi:MAG: undecaprenyldiphospho-muramoylpentapeptide beta-N-acetylglucosaminyltransferase [Steroidobacteraceae bacterium]
MKAPLTAPVAMIMAGGTGGHVYPALALARELRRRSWQVVWLGTQRGLEARVVPLEQIPIEWLSISGLRGKGLWAWLAAPLRLVRALREALAAMRRHQPCVVVGLGGFVSGPGGVAAWLQRRPLLIHEQNAVAGLTNRCLARLAREVFSGFPDAFGPGVSTRTIGNPVRDEIAALPPPAARFAARSGAIRLLVVGGSLGAARLNSVVPHALAQLQGRFSLEVQHQAGERWIDNARRAYAEAGVRARVAPYIEDMAEAYGWADLVLCRAGALTIAELTAAGVGAILVPYPHAVDDHQTSNAQQLVSEGAALLIADRDLSAERLASELGVLCAGRGKLLAMAERARLLARGGAGAALADACMPYAQVAA